MKAVPRNYKGVEFRSTLEADWAYTLDVLDIAWNYEPVALELGDGTRYLPDFYLPTITTWLEVKGPGVPGVDKVDAFRREVVVEDEQWWHPSTVVVLAGAPIHDRAVFQVSDSDGNGWSDHGVLAACSACSGYWFLDETGSYKCRRCGAEDGDRHVWSTWRSMHLPFHRIQWQPRRSA